MTEPTVSEVLRKPFTKSQIGKLPRITCRDCARAHSRVCERHEKINCATCRQWITAQHIHIDYVGHAAITDRLLQADPQWNWRPAYPDITQPAVVELLTAAVVTGNTELVRYVTEHLPPLQDESGMWIRLTVGGVERLGYASDDRGGPDHDKILIGDGLRNAAMRFGVGLDLWSKEDLTQPERDSDDDSPPAPPPDHPAQQPPAQTAGRDWIAEAQAATTMDELLAIGAACNAAGDYHGKTRTALLRRRVELKDDATPNNRVINGYH